MRWDRKGNMLVTAGKDGTSKVVDFGTGGIFHTAVSSDFNNPSDVSNFLMG